MNFSVYKTLLSSCLFLTLVLLSSVGIVNAQSGSVYTVAGTGAADGGIGMDAAGNLYYADKGNKVIRKVDVSGFAQTLAGTWGVSGSTGDGGPATAATLGGDIRGISVTSSGDIYISDGGRVRKVNGASGIITTVAGGGTSKADGVPAITASLSLYFVFVDFAGDIYVGSDNKIRRIDGGTGIITTIAGTGAPGDSGDGGPAILSGINGSAKSICEDNAGNLYIITEKGDRIRKIDAITGIITTVVGGGSSTADGVPATSTKLFDAHSCGVDGDGNIFIADWNRYLIRRVDANSGIIQTIAGMMGGSMSDGTPALLALLRAHKILVNPASGNIYFSDISSAIKMFSFTPMMPLTGSIMGGYSSDSFSINIYKQCAGPKLTVRTKYYQPGVTLRTDFGDGTADTSILVSSWSDIGGFVRVNHVYPTSDTYTVTHVLCNSGVPVDTFSYNYHHVFCSNMSVKFYNDRDFNCAKEGSEPFVIRQVVTEVDSNGVPVDTIKATSGFNYLAYGTPGDIYRFKILSVPTGLYTSCPAPGSSYDTLHAGITTNTSLYMALSCASSSSVDLGARAYIPVTGQNDQWGHIYFNNSYCMPADAGITLNFSPKYIYKGGASLLPTSSSSNSITWTIPALSNADPAPGDIHFAVWHNPAYPYPKDGDTVNERIIITPIGGYSDLNLSDNVVIRIDTVRASCDPNAIEVSPTCFNTDTTLHFTVHFENIGSSPAINIYVMDTLARELDPSTFNIDMSTHNMFVTKIVESGRTIFRFDFPNINLADSSDHAKRDGMFMYTIRNRAGLARGRSINNRVGIYFDYNDVLMTNTATTIKGCPTPLFENSIDLKATAINLYPNPVGDELVIQQQPDAYREFSVANILGQTMLRQNLQQATERINVKSFPAGMYYITFYGRTGSEVKKFVKQ